MNYRSEIDGLRALAVIPVILFHAGFQAFSGGFVGVDVFFVISGYLITTIIASELEQGNFSLIKFYERRVRRILPALFFVMLVCLPFAWAWLLPTDMRDFSQSLVAVGTFTSNILFWRETGYFDEAAELKPLLHTWSLSVEEQFYVLYPLFLMLFWRFGKRRLIVLVGLTFIASLTLAQWGVQNYPVPTFFLLPTRGWELLIGSFTAFYLLSAKRQNFDRIVCEIGGWLGIAFILYALITFNQKMPFPGLYALWPTLGAALFIVFANQRTSIGQLFGNKVLVWIGLISYSAYLWHQPLFVFARHRSFLYHYQNQILLAVLVVISFVLAYLSWRFVETPFRAKDRFTRTQIFRFAFLGGSFFIAFGMLGHLSNGFIHSRKNSIESKDIVARMLPNVGLNWYCAIESPETLKCKTSDSPEVLLWGDSYAMHLAQGLQASKPDIQLVQKTVSVCGPFLGIAPINAKYVRSWAEKCIETNDKVFDFLQKSTSIKYVVLSSPLTQYVGVGAKVLQRNGEIVSGEVVAAAAMIETVKRIKAIGKTPVLFSPPPRNGNDIGGCLKKSIFFGKDKAFCDVLVTHSTQRYREVWSFLKEVEKHATVVWLSDYLCSTSSCKASFDDVLIFRDSGHLSYEGSAYLGKQMNFYGRLEDAARQAQK